MDLIPAAFGSPHPAEAEPGDCCFLWRSVCLPDWPINAGAASTPLSKQGTKIVIKHINVPGISQVTWAYIGIAVKQRIKFKMLAVIYKLPIVLQNKLIYGAFIWKRRQGTAPQLTSPRHPDHSPALLQCPK